ncbi:hypothetical protein Nepgr_033568 [Nepenthes gracilis]|uniref:Uncharacterized protein n=1 Tax=Nepenthes gracilis TaxID=150966 RepID=A0AAD3Y8R5_NEPGR|nr:hypothetical protein Nepgr_033568 [Nepenthes gracilis]
MPSKHNRIQIYGSMPGALDHSTPLGESTTRGTMGSTTGNSAPPSTGASIQTSSDSSRCSTICNKSSKGLSNPVPYESPHSEDHVESDCRASLPPIDSNGIAGHLHDSVIADALSQPEPITTPITVLTAESNSVAIIENLALLIADSLALTSPNYPYPVSVPNGAVLDEPGPSNIGLVYPTKFFTRSPVLDPPSCELEFTYHHSSDDVGGGDCKSPNGAILDSQSTPGQPVPLLPDSTISELPALAPSFVEFGSQTAVLMVVGKFCQIVDAVALQLFCCYG